MRGRSNLNLVGHFQDPGVTKKGHQRVCDQHAGGPGCAENRGGSGAPFVVPCRLSGGSRRQGYAILEVWGFERCRRGKSTDPRVPIPVFAASQILEC